jgi:heavy metal translocating P-type ATPase
VLSWRKTQSVFYFLFLSGVPIMLLDVGILFSIYFGVKYYAGYQNKIKTAHKKFVKSIPTSSIKKVSREKTNLQPVEKYQYSLMDNISHSTERESKHYLKISAVSIGLATIGNVSLPLHLLSVTTISYTSWPILKQAEKSLIEEGKIGHDMLISVLTALALYTAQGFALSVGVLFYHLSRQILAKTQDHSKKVLTNLFDQQPNQIWVLKNQVEVEVPLETVSVNDIVVVNTGEVVPIDGVIIEGHAMIDQHTLTGESQPAEKGIGEKVFAATSVVSGKFKVKVEKTGLDTTVSKIGELLNRTADFKTGLQSKGEKWADQIAIPLLGVSAFGLPFVGLIATTAILNSSFGNRMRLTAPLCVLNHLNLASHKGILVKDGRALECLTQVDTVLFDKTGTLTEEQPKVGQIIICEDYQKNDLLTYAAAAEGKLSHPIAKAIVKKAKESKLTLPEIEDSQYQIGLGITVFLDQKIIKVGSHRFMSMAGVAIPNQIKKAMDDSHSQGHSLILVAINDEIKGAIEIQPSIRPEVKSIINGLRQRGIKHIAIVSGDHKQPTEKLANTLGMDSYYYDVLPENKAQIVEQLQQEGKVVCFIGDGVNDAIAIKKADVSLSLKGATSIATDLAQVIFMDGRLSRLCELFDIANSLETNLRNTLKILLIPVILDIGGAFLLNFSMMNAVVINQIGLIFALGNTKITHISKPDRGFIT